MSYIQGMDMKYLRRVKVVTKRDRIRKNIEELEMELMKISKVQLK